MAQSHGYKNPILPGFHPDPSVCRVGDDYYLVNSSFQYFPGIPIYHSKDLVNWESLGYVLNRPSQLKLDGAGFWNGVYAPGIRYHDGTFYMTVTNTSDRGNFYVTTTDPRRGEWSDPIWVDQAGIDPDIFFDDDGKTYFVSAQGVLVASEIDLKTGKLLSEPRPIWQGTGGRCAEGPRIYKKDGWYYQLIAEGGTEYGHKATIARSRSLFGEWEPCPANPILTHADLAGMMSPIQCTGHADLVEAHDGSWWMVCLGVRPHSYNHHVLGRETFLAPVQWNEEGWPVVNGNGTISLDMDVPTLPQHPFDKKPQRDEFTDKHLGNEWNTLCRPHSNEIALDERKGWLRLKPTTQTLHDTDSPIFIGQRQTALAFTATTRLDFSHLKEGAQAGLTVYMSNDYHYALSVERREGKSYLVLRYFLSMLRHTEKEIPLDGNDVCLRVEGSNEAYSFAFATDGKTFLPLGSVNTRFLSSETAGGFTGVYLALFAQSNNKDAGYADFDYFDMKQ